MARKIHTVSWNSSSTREIREIGNTNFQADQWSVVVLASDEYDNVYLKPYAEEEYKFCRQSFVDTIARSYVYLGAGNDILVSNAADFSDDDRNYERSYHEIFNGGDGDDYIRAYQANFGQGAELLGGTGKDTLLGSLKDDKIYGDSDTSTVSQNQKWEGDRYLADPVSTLEYADTLLGGRGDDEIHGEYGNDTIFGGLGSDKIYGGVGNDYIDAGVRDGSSVDETTTGAG